MQELALARVPRHFIKLSSHGMASTLVNADVGYIDVALGFLCIIFVRTLY
jgi:hypothetical protein